MKADSVEGHAIFPGFDRYAYSADWLLILKAIHLSHAY